MEWLLHSNIKPVKNVDTYPYSAVGVIKTKFGGKYFVHGTGCLIGPNIVLTVIHNCDPYGGNTAMEIEFIPAPIQKRGGKGFKVIKKYLPKQENQMH